MIWQVPSTIRASRAFSCSNKLLNLAMRCRQYSSSVSGPGSSPACVRVPARVISRAPAPGCRLPLLASLQPSQIK
jgi:hypothetical protein